MRSHCRPYIHERLTGTSDCGLLLHPLLFLDVLVDVSSFMFLSSAPDVHTLNEDGELWLAYEGLKETNRYERLQPENILCLNMN